MSVGLATIVRHLLPAAFSYALICVSPAHADGFRWPQPGGHGTPVFLTYSFSNLLDGTFGPIPEADLRASTAEAFGLWSSYAPLSFTERPDSGPIPRDQDYDRATHPDIRIGYHPIGDDAVFAHAYLPRDTEPSGLAGDIHFSETTPFSWSVGRGFPTIDFLEVITHEIGHAVGVDHILYADAIMQPYYRGRYHGRGTAYLLTPDILAVQSLYGSGVGSVHPMPEPSTMLLLATGVVTLFVRRRAVGCGARLPMEAGFEPDDLVLTKTAVG
jgi:Matrixin/PEP-CTERM motif